MLHPRQLRLRQPRKSDRVIPLVFHLENYEVKKEGKRSERSGKGGWEKRTWRREGERQPEEGGHGKRKTRR
eukprot:362529-Chlamydomonas_euryale.AAC.5